MSQRCLGIFQALFKTVQDLFSPLKKRIDQLCQPNPKYIPRQSQREIAHQRNKSIATIYIYVIACFLIDIIFKGGPVVDNLIRIFFCVLCLSYLFFSCRYHPQIFKCYYNLVCLAYGPSAVLSSPDGIYISFFFVLVVPLFVQLITGSFWHFLFQALFNNILLNTYYQKNMKEMLINSSSDEILKGLTDACNMTMALQVILLGLMGRFIEQAHQNALDFEQEKNEAENQKVFLLGFSHELRNLINSLTGNVKLASLERISEQVEKFLHNAEVCGELLLHMINNILDTGKSHIGELEVNPTPTQTYELFEKTWAICSELIERKGLNGCIKIPKNMPRMLMMDSHRITQIFLNLVGNAIKFTERGSVNITVEWLSHKKEVKEECFQPYPFSTDEQDEGLFEKQQSFSTLKDEFFVLGPHLHSINQNLCQPSIHCRRGVIKVIVSDTGCGMDAEQTSKLFQKFMQVTSDEAKKKLGTGLGLYISKQLCQKMKGEIKAYSQKNKGSLFIFCLPAETTDDRYQIRAYEDLDSVKSLIAARNLKMMIVDDSLSNQLILRGFFERIAIEVSEIAVNGVEAYQKYMSHLREGNPLQIMTMDLDMPIMDGKETARKIREFESVKGLNPCFLLIINGNCDESEINECLDKEGRIRANAFLRKPIRMEDLVEIVASNFLSSAVPVHRNQS